MRICKQVKFIQGTDLDDLQAKLNDALINGAEICAIDIASLTGAVTVTEYVGEIQKTLLDELEDEFGCHNCSECPFFEESSDRRRKWHTCSKGKRVQKTSRCCSAYYESLRKEVTSEISEDKGKDELLQFESRGRSGKAESFASGGVRPIKWSKQLPPSGTRIAFGIPEDTNRRIIQGGVERCYTRLP